MRTPGSRFPSLLFVAAALNGGLSAQVLLIDRGPSTGNRGGLALREANLRAAWTEESGHFVGDEFSIGSAGEVWFIDTLRTRVLVDETPGHLFDKLTLFGGIAGQPLTAEQAECACHSVTTIKTASASGAPDVSVTRAASQPPGYQEGGKTFRLWEIEFRNVRWSVPGGVGLQFALKAETSHAWFNYASPIQTPHRLRVFDGAGQLRSFLGGDENGINLQVWGHLSGRVALRRVGVLLQAVLSGGPGLDAAQVDPASLRLGGRRSSPVTTKVEDVDGDGIADLVIAFRATDVDLPMGSASVCLTGTRRDGVPFEGCDLLSNRRP
jgi:hypothetical protein